LASQIAEASYQIEPAEARVIAHNLRQQRSDNLAVLAQLQTQDDLLLREPVNITIYQMPGTYWKVVTVFPVSDIEQAARNITRTLSAMTLAGLVVWALLLFLFIWPTFFHCLRFL